MDAPVHKEYERISKPEYISGEIQATVGSMILNYCKYPNLLIFRI